MCRDGSCEGGIAELLGQLYGEYQASSRSFGAVPRTLFPGTVLPEPPLLRADRVDPVFPPEEGDDRPSLAERYGLSPLGPTIASGRGDVPFYLQGSVPPPRTPGSPRQLSDAEIGRRGGSPAAPPN